jgi:hypothetical protein
VPRRSRRSKSASRGIALPRSMVRLKWTVASPASGSARWLLERDMAANAGELQPHGDETSGIYEPNCEESRHESQI